MFHIAYIKERASTYRTKPIIIRLLRSVPRINRRERGGGGNEWQEGRELKGPWHFPPRRSAAGGNDYIDANLAGKGAAARRFGDARRRKAFIRLRHYRSMVHLDTDNRSAPVDRRVVPVPCIRGGVAPAGVGFRSRPWSITEETQLQRGRAQLNASQHSMTVSLARSCGACERVVLFAVWVCPCEAP